ncbi:MAG: isocitrate/isopropylmalate dehydrogenase family protein, partial [Armatimonadetes bacterium]|nr:isocitrate/isopropylmalate dehydrogenase family protein [Armatimonadota bacterium]
MGHYRIGVLEGDHIGPEIVPIAVDVLNEASRACGVSLAFEQLPVGLAAHDRLGTTLPDGTVRALERLDAWVLGPVTTHLYTSESMINPSGFLRKHFDLYANVRPIASRPGVESLRPDIDLVIVRENTEGFYSDRNVLDGNGEFRPNADTVVSVRVTNRRACRRIAEYAFGLASRRRKRLVTAVHKANIFRHGCGMFLEECRKAQTAHPDVQLNDYHVDAFAMHLIRSPQLFDVVVTTNLFGDILSDEAAGLIGGLGLAPSLNVGDHFAMAQAAHGSAPDLAGRGVANP